jgi:transaldolase
MEIYYDGINVNKWLNNEKIYGYTTNCSIMSASKYKSYVEFYNTYDFGNKPISFQIWEDDEKQAKQQIDEIASIGSNVFVKIPIINSIGEVNSELILYAVSKNYNINITAIYTLDQITVVRKLLDKHESPAIISIFIGSISDIFVEPSTFISYYNHIFKNKPNCKSLWAGCREIFAVQKAQELKCNIITIPDGVIDKLDIQNKSLTELSIERVIKFKTDAINSKLNIL